MSEIKITKDSLENAILKDGNFVSGYIAGNGYIDASGYGAHAEGYSSSSLAGVDASGNGAHAEGIETKALANGAHAEGYSTKASGTASHAEGISSFASGDYSHAGGKGTIASQEAMTAIGKYNTTNRENTLFVVGDGPSIARRSDAFRVNSLGSETETNSVPSSVQAKVNGVSDVYLGCPIGTVVMWAGGGSGESWDASTDAPDGWLICDGRVIPTDANHTNTSTNYKEFLNLLKIISTKYGTYDPPSSTPQVLKYTVKNEIAVAGSNNVCIPNFTKKFPLGAGYKTDSLYAEYKFTIKAGQETYYSYNGSTGGAAEHKLTANESGLPDHLHDIHLRTARVMQESTGLDVLYETAATATSSYDKSGKTVDNTASASQAHNNIPPFLAINFIIKYK